eukprot:CAMPEP_0177771470 /NCGR_PEP_ID=MMETSP0491_2-20121128/11613_1 /TAXON_ID=63592 /ORGANISM="Tetraselmis chuii, Strain PLY429" /LENGTH=337 /DNA_ID=CAMNT_0019289029 /DNA_START=194 /DNA_END=1207 /DNA_ORIENTATION=-
MSSTLLSLGSARGTALARPPYRPPRSGRTALVCVAGTPNRLPANVPGSFWVDDTCIDCDTCRWIAPETFSRQNSQSAVTAQPTNTRERTQAARALSACPTFSIHLDDARAGELKEVASDFPLAVDGSPGVYHTGFHSHASFAATPYLVTREKGNVMVDVPRYNPGLASRIEGMGGIRYIFLTHRDDVSDHAKWAERFPQAVRVIHKTEVNARQGTDKVERQLEGEGPWELDDAGDHQILFVPGHTPGCMALHYTPCSVLFTGDTLGWSASLGRLTIFRQVNWYDVDLQLESVASLEQLPVLAVLPGHGRRKMYVSQQEWRDSLRDVLTAENYQHANA